MNDRLEMVKWKTRIENDKMGKFERMYEIADIVYSIINSL